MDKLKDFKDIANKMLEDITVDEELRQRTLDRCKTKKFSFMKYKGVPAIGALAFLLVICVYNFNFKGNDPAPKLANGSKGNVKITLNRTYTSADENVDTKAYGKENATKVQTKETHKAPEKKEKVVKPKAIAKADTKASKAAKAKAKASAPMLAMADLKQETSFSSGTNGADTVTNKENTSDNSKSGEADSPPAQYSIMAKSSTTSLDAARQANTIEEVKKRYDGVLRTPSVLPDGFEQKGIDVLNNEAGNIASIWVNYQRNQDVLTVYVEKNGQIKEKSGYNLVDINGIPAYIRVNRDNNPVIVELKMIIENSLYIIQGSITEEDAIMMTKGLK